MIFTGESTRHQREGSSVEDLLLGVLLLAQVVAVYWHSLSEDIQPSGPQNGAEALPDYNILKI